MGSPNDNINHSLSPEAMVESTKNKNNDSSNIDQQPSNELNESNEDEMATNSAPSQKHIDLIESSRFGSSSDSDYMPNQQVRIYNNPPRRSYRIENQKAKWRKNHEYKEGDCVWAIWEDFPWWPGQIRFLSKRKRARNNSLSVKWFGDLPMGTNECKLSDIIPWDPEEKDRIFPDVDDQDWESFNNATDECNTMYLQICKERGIEPIETALDHGRAKKEKEDQENERRCSLRSASKKKEKRVDQQREIVEKKEIKKKRRLKRKYNEAMDDDDKEQEDENEDDAEKENVNKRRRSDRIHWRNQRRKR